MLSFVAGLTIVRMSSQKLRCKGFYSPGKGLKPIRFAAAILNASLLDFLAERRGNIHGIECPFRGDVCSGFVVTVQMSKI